MDRSLLHPVRQRTIAPLTGWSIGAALVGWLAFSFAGLPWLSVFPAILALLVVGGFWIAAAVRSVRRPGDRRMVVVSAAILAVTIVGIALHLPTQVRFALSQPSFQAFAEQAGPPPQGEISEVHLPNCPAHLGLYTVSSCEATTGGYLFFDPLGNALVDYAGFAYLPNGAHLEADAGFELQELTNLRGDWYIFVASW